MNTILEISNWNQLVKARSEGYGNLRIVVSQYNSEELKGTKISVVDYNTNDTYFSAFATDIQSTIIPETATMLNDEILEVINKFGFNVRFSTPTVLAESVVIILKGLYEQGYRYIYRDYCPKYPLGPNYTNVFASVDISWRKHDYMISKSPSFVKDEWEWVRPFTTYPIIDLIENGTVNNGQPILP